MLLFMRASPKRSAVCLYPGFSLGHGFLRSVYAQTVSREALLRNPKVEAAGGMVLRWRKRLSLLRNKQGPPLLSVCRPGQPQSSRRGSSWSSDGPFPPRPSVPARRGWAWSHLLLLPFRTALGGASGRRRLREGAGPHGPAADAADVGPGTRTALCWLTW